jgi:hypothetical protein
LPFSQQLLASDFRGDAYIDGTTPVYRWQHTDAASGEKSAFLVPLKIDDNDNEQLDSVLKRVSDYGTGNLVSESKITGGGFSGDLYQDHYYDTGQFLQLSNDTMKYIISADNPETPGKAMQRRELTPQELGIKPLEQKVEATGFVIGGVNDTELIKRLPTITGRSIQELTDEMRPDVSSMAGFLGPEDELLATMAEDNDTVQAEGFTHQELAEPLKVVQALIDRGMGVSSPVIIGGHKYTVQTLRTMGTQGSPFGDGLGGSCDYTITNMETGASVKTSDLGIDLIDHYGFYEGQNTVYRTPPLDIIKTFTHLQPPSL